MKNLLLSIGVVGLLMGAVASVVPATTVSAAEFKDGDRCTARFLTFPAWYRGLERKNCNIVPPSSTNGITTFVFTIVLNIIEIGLQLVAYAAVGYTIYGGFKYLTSSGDPSRVTSGRKIITNALVGLVLSFMSIAIVNLVANNLR